MVLSYYNTKVFNVLCWINSVIIYNILIRKQSLSVLFCVESFNVKPKSSSDLGYQYKE